MRSKIASEMALISSESCGFKLLCPVLDDDVIRNRLMFASVKMLYEYSLSWYLRVVTFAECLYGEATVLDQPPSHVF
jgi:hypothetical protein